MVGGNDPGSRGGSGVGMLKLEFQGAQRYDSPIHTFVLHSIHLNHILFLSCFLAFTGAAVAQKTLQLCPGLEVKKLTDHSYIHTSYLELPTGMFPCNGVVYVTNGEAIVLDTPVNDSLSARLMAWIEKDLGARLTGLVVNHFHNDCTGGLGAFIEQGCETYSHKMTYDILKARNLPCTDHFFTDSLDLLVGGQRVVSRYFGEAHTQDNIVTYIPSEHLLFGGCMVKESGAGYGNLADANTEAWPGTVRKVKAAYPGVKIVVPGHGREGRAELLDYTIELFERPRGE